MALISAFAGVEVFVRAARSGSFTAAAAQCQSARNIIALIGNRRVKDLTKPSGPQGQERTLGSLVRRRLTLPAAIASASISGVR